ncbi:hypothetical protein [Candidatus Binatus sp.]|uniref:hypothetical protein n=1 Tax=Candidatus Binatus sp. TaxID=2811406 RepID=UPI002F921142
MAKVVDEVGIRLSISTGPVRARPALSVSRFSADSFSAIVRLSFPGACAINQQIHNSYYYCYFLLKI